MEDDIAEFHKKFNISYDGPPRMIEDQLHEFRVNFMYEELAEYETHSIAVKDAIHNKNHAMIAYHLEHMLDALVDLTYVVLGTAHIHGFDFGAAWDRVHQANMRKVRASSARDSKRGSSFDVVKPPGWQPPDLSDLVENHSHRSSDVG